MKRKIEMTLPAHVGAGVHAAFGISLASFHGVEWECDDDGENYIYKFAVEYDKIEGIAHDAMTVYPVNDVPVLDVDAGLHFTISRHARMRRTGDDR